MTIRTQSDEALEKEVGHGVRQARLRMDLDQVTLAERANVSLSAVKALEAGKGSTVRTLGRVLRALGRDDVFAAIAPSALPLNPRYGDPSNRKRATARSRR